MEKSEGWVWPEELDTLMAAPQHNKLLFENDFVRVLDTLIAPGEITKVHTHKWPASLYIVCLSDFIRYDDDQNIILDSRKLTKGRDPSTALWTEALPPHAVENVGKKNIHIIRLKLRNSPATHNDCIGPMPADQSKPQHWNSIEHL